MIKMYIKRISLMYCIIVLLSPLIIYTLANFKVKSCGEESINESDTNTFILQTNKWEYGNYIINTYNENEEKIYIRTLTGNNFHRKLTSDLTGKFSDPYMFNEYRVEGKLISTDETFRNSPVYDLYIDNWWILSEIQRDSFLGAFLPNYYLTIFDFKIFSNIFIDFIIIFILSYIINYVLILIYRYFRKLKFSTSIKKYVFYTMVSICAIFVSVFLLEIIACIYA